MSKEIRMPCGLQERGIKQTHPTEWNGESCEARRVLIRVGYCPFPEGWYKHLVGTKMRAVEVKQGDSTFYLADQDGNGWHKVTMEGGGPHWGHSAITCAEILKVREAADLDENDCHCATNATGKPLEFK